MRADKYKTLSKVRWGVGRTWGMWAMWRDKKWCQLF